MDAYKSGYADKIPHAELMKKEAKIVVVWFRR
jgi:hypothetical protein